MGTTLDRVRCYDRVLGCQMFTQNSEFLAELTEILRVSIESQVIPTIKDETRVLSGALRDSTRVNTIGPGHLQISQGGTSDCDYAVWIEFRYQEFSKSIAAIDWDSR